MIYSYGVNYEYTHYHFYSLLGCGSAENQPLPYRFHLSRSSGPCVYKPIAGIQIPGARQLLLRFLRLHQTQIASSLSRAVCLKTLTEPFPLCLQRLTETQRKLVQHTDTGKRSLCILLLPQTERESTLENSNIKFERKFGRRMKEDLTPSNTQRLTVLILTLPLTCPLTLSTNSSHGLTLLQVIPGP